MKKRILLTPVVFLILTALFGCATGIQQMKGETLPAEETFDLVTNTLYDLSHAYETLDATGFMSMVSVKYIGGYQNAEEALRRDLQTLKYADIAIFPERVWEGEHHRVFVEAGWSKNVIRANLPQGETSTGKTSLIFIRYPGNILKLLSMDGDALFPLD
jgi:hypothetical protein